MSTETGDNGPEAVIGLEIHVQLATMSKMFCADPAEYGRPPNSAVCPVCLGLPGALPVPNAKAVELGIRAALGLHCEVHERSVFARKHYFYPDTPKGYQITQYDPPLASKGYLDVPDPDGYAISRVGIRRVHLEEDSGKLLHERLPGRTGIDLNRAGIPLLEIVTEPELRSPRQARAFLDRLKRALEYMRVSDCNMEEGSLRVDANISLQDREGVAPGGRTELKNLNSFRNVERALRFEIDRHAGIRSSGGEVTSETMLWDDAAAETRGMRSKEAAPDYRYLPEPDIPPLVVASERIEGIRGTLPEMPWARCARLVSDLGVSAEHAHVLTASRELADYYEAVVAASAEPGDAANWVLGEVLAALKSEGCGLESFPVRPADLAGMLDLVASGRLSRAASRDVFGRMVETGKPAAQILGDDGMLRIRDEDAVRGWIDAVLAEHSGEVRRYREGENQLFDFFMGRVMRRSGGKADPDRVRPLLLEALEES